MSAYSPVRLAVAPMLAWTDRHCRFFHRLLTRKTLLYTEMVHSGALLFGDRERFLAHSAEEHPLALQLGGSDPDMLAKAAKIVEDHGFDEVNLNVGCPSERVQNGSFGACLMLEPALVGRSVGAMKAAVSIPVTVKCRIGVDEQDSGEALDALTRECVAAGVDGLIVHARKAWLKGLSPRENRDVPPLDYPRVYRLKQDNPALAVSINGGVVTLAQARAHLTQVDGVMIGRAAYQNPALLLDADPDIFGTAAPFSDIFQVVEALEPYIARQMERGERLADITRHILGLFNGRRGARAFRRHLATAGMADGASLETLREAVSLLRRG
ncbi:MAG: tRNA dihydrouridine(20/20a) synthase DusA [Methylobacteriaceae bacterium]|jgi:tRNA-dihydrouridine synthase A|nr:tRNA dihydrouridine(20/20a) synthase DusA [Methylobacteriaceae bacterium]